MMRRDLMDRLKSICNYTGSFLQPITFDVFLLQLKYSLKGSQQDFLDSADTSKNLLQFFADLLPFTTSWIFPK